MKKRNKVVLVIVILSGLLGIAGVVIAEGIHARVDGSALQMAYDDNGDGIPAVGLHLKVVGTAGVASGEGWSDVYPLATSTNCNAQDIEFGFSNEQIVLRFMSGDQLFVTQTVNAYMCVTPSNTFYGQKDWIVTGGTGKFANANGVLTNLFSGSILQVDPTTGGVLIAGFAGTLQGNI